MKGYFNRRFLLVENLIYITYIFTLENKGSDKESNDYNLFRVMKPQKDLDNLIEGILLFNNQTIPMICDPNN